MMRAYIDTNILVDLVLARQEYKKDFKTAQIDVYEPQQFLDMLA